MPIYEFECGKCGHEFTELFASAKDKRKPACPECGSKKTERQFSLFASRSGGDKGGGAPARSGCSGCSSKKCSSCH